MRAASLGPNAGKGRELLGGGGVDVDLPAGAGLAAATASAVATLRFSMRFSFSVSSFRGPAAAREAEGSSFGLARRPRSRACSSTTHRHEDPRRWCYPGGRVGIRFRASRASTGSAISEELAPSSWPDGTCAPSCALRPTAYPSRREGDGVSIRGRQGRFDASHAASLQQIRGTIVAVR